MPSCDTTNLQRNNRMEPLRKKQKTGAVPSVSALQERRANALRYWFYDTQNADPAIREQAQARIQLQLQLRVYRKAIDKWKGKLRAAERAGDRSEAEKFDARRVANVQQLHIWATVLRTSFSLKNDNKKKTEVLLAAWHKNTCVSLDQVLKDANLDRPEDFPHDPSLHICDTEWSQRHCGYQSFQEEEEREDTMKSSISTSGVGMSHVEPRPSNLLASLVEPDTIRSPIWNRYHYFMIVRYIATGMPLSLATAKLAMQKEAFDCHAEIELDARTAHANTSFMTADKSRPLFASQTTRMRTSHVRTQGLWKLASTKLWSYLEDANCWEWTPGGYLSIETFEDGMSTIYLDFGHRTFKVGNIAFPEFVRTHPLPLKTNCSETGEDVFMGLTPLADGFLKVHMSARVIVPMDEKCEMPHWAKDVIELVGVCAADIT